MKKLLLFIALTIFGLGLNAQSVDDETTIDYDGYSLAFRVTSVEPAECKVSGYTGEPIDVTIPSTVTISGTEYSVTSIGSWAFSLCSSLTSIEIPNSVTSIGSGAFQSCSLTIIEIPNSVTSIGDWAFDGCSSLTSIEIPNSVTSIGGVAFLGCSSLTSIVVAEGNTVYDSRENCNAIIETSSNTLIAGCQNTVIPNSVTSIGDYAFYDCDGLTSIGIPNSVTSIGWYAFSYCSSLTSIEIPSSVTSIRNFAFSNCSSLTSIVVAEGNTVYDSGENCNAIIETSSNTLIAGCQNTVIPNPVTSIGSGAFYGCSSLTSIEIPNSVTSIGNEVFSYCSSLTSIVVAEGNTVYDSRENCNAIIETSSNTLIAGCQNTVIPNSVTSIGDYAFQGCSSLTSIEIPNSVTYIGNYAFYYCESLRFIRCHADEVPTTGEMPLGEGYSIQNIQVPEASVDDYKAASYWNEYNITKIYPYPYFIGEELVVYYDSYSLKYTAMEDYRCSVTCYAQPSEPTSITIPTTVTFGETELEVTSIGYEAFYYCESLTSIEIPNSVTSIGEGAFQVCSSLKVIKCHAENVPETGYYVFDHCPSDMTIYVPEVSLPEYKSTYPWNEFTILPGSLEFRVTSVEPAECELSYYSRAPIDVTIPSTVEIEGIEYNVTSIGDSTFYWCSSLTSIEISNSITSIGNYAFYSCSSLKVIKCHAENVPETGNDVFYDCPSDMIIYVPENSVEDYKETSPWNAFTILPGYSLEFRVTSVEPAECELSYYSGAPIDVTIPSTVEIKGIEYNVTSIGDSTFYWCSSLTSIVIPNSVTSIGYRAFSSCSSLTSMIVTEGNTVYDSRENCNAIIETSSNKLIAGCQNTVIPNSVTSIGDEAFDYCSSLTSIEIPNSVTSIGSSAFSDCSSLTSITFGENSQLTSIGYGAFSECSSLTSITFGENSQLTSIGYDAFYDCSSLTSITFGENSQLTSIGNYAFYDCSSLTSITFGENSQLTSIGNYAFYDCSSLTSITFGENSQLTSIGYLAFYDCSSLTSIEIPNSVTSIGNEVFSGCSNLASVIFEENSQLTTIAYHTFFGCSSLTSIEIPNSVTSIGYGAFSECSSLTSIEIPNSVTSIRDYAFSDCSSLRVIKCYAESVPETGYDIFGSCPSDMIIYVPENSVEDYKVTSPWNAFTILSLNEGPRNITATTESVSSVNLSWDNCYADSYNVYRNGDSIIANVTNTTYTDICLEYNTEYCYTVTAVRNETESDKSEEKCVKTFDLPITTPENLVAEALSTSSISLSWNEVENALSYNVYQANELIANIEETTFTVNNLEYNTEYCYTVTAVRNETESDKSEEKCAKTFDLPITTPENLIANVLSTSSIILTWDNVENALSYNIYRNGEMIINVTNTNYTDNNLEYNTEYCYTVTAVRNETESDKSEEKCAKTLGESIEELSSSINIYPNPVENDLFITTEMNVEEIAIYDVYGRHTMSQQVNKTTSQQVVDVTDLEAGVYFVKVATNEGEIVKRFIKK